MYDSTLHKRWVDFLFEALKTTSQINLDSLYLLYNTFYKIYHEEIFTYIRDSYKKGIEYLKDHYIPIKLKVPKDKEGGSGRSLRSPFGSYYYTVKNSQENWLGPNQTLSEGLELWSRYFRNGERTSQLCNAGAMRPIIAELGNVGYKPYIRIAKRNRIPNDLEKWFRLARNRDTPLPDTSRIYHISKLDNGQTETGLGLIEKEY